MALQAIREDPISAGMAGINVVRERIIAWLLSALVAGLAGGVFAWYVSVFYPETVFSVEFTIFAIVFALFGGSATVSGRSSASSSSTASTMPSAFRRRNTFSSSTAR
jgi:branched-chain amino acid transport system permease protein